MSVNRLSLDITDAQKTQVANDTNKLAASTEGFNVVISKEELKSLPRIADGRIPFVQKCADYCVSNPALKPAVLDDAEFQKDLKAYLALREMARPLRQILERLETAMAVAGSEAFYSARDYYKMVQLSARMGVPGAQAVYDDLRQLFEQPARTTEPKP
jgi:hypothetical protein